MFKAGTACRVDITSPSQMENGQNYWFSWKMYRFKGIPSTWLQKLNASTGIGIVHLGPPDIPLRLSGIVRGKKWVISHLMLVLSNGWSNCHRNSCSITLLYVFDRVYGQVWNGSWKVRFSATTRRPYWSCFINCFSKFLTWIEFRLTENLFQHIDLNNI